MAAAISESGIAARLMTAARHSNRNATRTHTTKSVPRSSASVRFEIEISMNSAGRKMWLSTWIPGRPGRMSSSAWSMPWVTSSVLAHGNFSTTMSSPWWSLMTASPNSGWCPYVMVPRSARVSGVPSVSVLPETVTSDSDSGEVPGST